MGTSGEDYFSSPRPSFCPQQIIDNKTIGPHAMTMRLNGTSAYSDIKLGENQFVPKDVQVLRVGKFNHPKYGLFEISTQTLTEMKSNFDKRVRGIDMAFDYFHDSDKDAAAWVNKLELRENGTELCATVEWTPKAEQKLIERELRYFSPDLTFKWSDPESGATYSNVLFGGGLTNRPFVKEMKAIVADELKGVKMTELEQALAKVSELEATNVKLAEEKVCMEKKMEEMPSMDKVAELEMKIAALQAELAKAKEAEAMLMEDKKKADEAKMLAEKETEFTVLLTEGKACVAQKESYIKGDMKEFIKLAQPLNLKAQGSSSSASVEVDAAAIIKLAEEKEKLNPKLTRAESISLAKKELIK